MAVLFLQHKVASFDAWKRAFDGDPLGRAKSGVTRHAVLRPADDPDSVIVLLEFDTRERAEAMLARLRAMWERVGGQIGFGGAEGVQARILDDVERVEY